MLLPNDIPDLAKLTLGLKDIEASPLLRQFALTAPVTRVQFFFLVFSKNRPSRTLS